MTHSKRGADTPTDLPLRSGMGRCGGSVALAESLQNPVLPHLSAPITFPLCSYSKRRFQAFNEREGV